MKKYSIKQIQSLQALYNSADFLQKYTYPGTDLGAICDETRTRIRVWAPNASSVTLLLYRFSAPDGSSNSSFTPSGSYPMTAGSNGTWFYETARSLHGIYYRFLVTEKEESRETTDPYAKACSANGQYSMIVRLSETDPVNWHLDSGPVLARPTDAVIYELHLRDLSMDSASGILHRGTFKALTETETRNSKGILTGLDHIRELGITHIHLLPCFDFSSVDELHPTFNWGYDPSGYNIPEGSYSSDPQNGCVRILEMKQMIQAIHRAGLGVILDVVYNHVADAPDSNFQQLVPYYYFRMQKDGSFSNGSACGNEVATERAMVRSFIVNSVAYWAEEYHIDGFRFDLMGLLDVETMQEISAKLTDMNPNILLYGEGWIADASTLPARMRATKHNLSRLPGIAAFNDNLRDAIKGNVFDASAKGFVTGKKGLCEDIRFGICGGCSHPQIDLKYVRSSDCFWAANPSQSINYVSAHDNLTLWDKLCLSYRSGSRAMRIRRNRLAAAIYLTSQGIPFLQAGEEFLRSKPSADGTGFDENSYRSPDCVNAIKWDELTKNYSVYEYYRGLIAFRKAHPALRLATAVELANHLSFLPDVPENTVGFLLTDHAGGDSLREICILFNPNRATVQFFISNHCWNVYVNGEYAGIEKIEQIKGGTIIVPPISCMILGRK